MAVRTTGDKPKGSPSARWRTAPTLAARAQQAASATNHGPMSSHLEPLVPDSEASVFATPDEDTILVRLPRSFASFLNQEFLMTASKAAAPTTTTALKDVPVAADVLRQQIADGQRQIQEATEQLAALEPTDRIVAAAKSNGRRNAIKTMGKIAGAVGVTGALALGGYYTYRYFKR